MKQKHRFTISCLLLILMVLTMVGYGASTEERAADTYFEIHFLDVGQGDCALVLCDGQAMLIDGGEVSESSKVFAYLQNRGVNHLDYVVISVGENHSYGHPAENTLSRLRDANVAVFRTDLCGTVICTSDGKTVAFEFEKRHKRVRSYPFLKERP